MLYRRSNVGLASCDGVSPMIYSLTVALQMARSKGGYRPMDNKTLLAEMHKIRKEIGDQMESVALRCIKAFNEVETRISKLEADIRDAKKPNKR